MSSLIMSVDKHIIAKEIKNFTNMRETVLGMFNESNR